MRCLSGRATSVLWEEVKKMEESLAQKRVDEGVRQVEDLQKVPELVAHQRLSQCEMVELSKEKKKRKQKKRKEKRKEKRKRKDGPPVK